MPHPLLQAVLITWRRNGAYAARLVEDLSDTQFLAQPVAGRVLNHPAWILSHLCVYVPIAAAMLRGQAFVDPIDDPYGQKSEPLADALAYLPAGQLRQRFSELHQDAERALLSAPDATVTAANPLERWRAMHPTVGDMVVTLMVKHESGHLGQLSMWRRAMGLARVAM